MAETGAASAPSLKGLREQMVAAAQALAEERRNQSGISPVPVPPPITIKTATKPVLDGSILRSEERQRLARERREEREKQQAAKETQILEKEKKAKLQYEKQIEEKQRKLKEQKLKEQQRRAAVEEKRKQKIEEEKEHYEAVVHRTLERSQRLETRQKRWSWGGSVTDSDGKTELPTAFEASKHPANHKQAESVISKRLSSSTALLNSPGKRAMEKKRSSSLTRVGSKLQSSPDLQNMQKEEKAARRSQFIPLESNVISRLLAPTQASLARSKSAATLSAEGKDPSAPNSSPAHAPKMPVRSRSIDRLKTLASSSSDNISLESSQKPEVGKLSTAGRRAPSPSLSNPRRSPSPAKLGKRPPSPAAIRQKTRPPSPSILRQRPPSPVTASKSAPIQRPSLTPNVLNIPKKKHDVDCKPKEKVDETSGQEQWCPPQTSEKEFAATASKTKEADTSSKSAPGTTTAEEATRVLAEKRRLAREQRERELLERAQKEEEERVRKEEIAKRVLDEQAQREDELYQLEEQKKMEEMEQQRLAEKERLQREEEEQEKLAELQQQREEAEAKAQEEANRHRQQQELIMQQNMQERLERKKRLEEIMKRTRKAEQNEAKNEEKSNEEDEDVEEDDLGLEKQDQPEKANYIDSPLERTPVPESLLQETSKTEPDNVFINGDEQLEVNQTEKDQNSEHFTQIKEASPPAKETIIENSGILHVNEASHPSGFLSNLNGKSIAWNFEEIIDLEVIPRTTRQSSDSMGVGISNQNLKDAAAVPPSSKLVFEEESTMNSLTKPIETASEL